MHAAGYPHDTLWDVVAANAWADEACYATLLPACDARPRAADAAVAAHAARPARTGGCSAFIATGTATVDGRPVMGHDTWTDYDGAFTNNVMFYVHPRKGYDFTYQSSGGEIWSGLGLVREQRRPAAHRDHAGRLRLHDDAACRSSCRAREAAQYDATVAQAVHTLVHRNNGAYSNEWLIGDKSRQGSPRCSSATRSTT